MKISTIQEGVEHLLISLEKQMELDQNQESCNWDPRNLGFTILQTWVDAPELKLSIWNLSQSVERRFLKSKIVPLSPARSPPSHSRWQFFMSGAGDITSPHIDPPLTRTVFWQVVGHKIWGIWPATKENLDVFEQSVAKDRTWKWAVNNLSESDRKIFIMQPGTAWDLKQSEIHACISLSPSVHAVQEFFYVEDAKEILDTWMATKEAWENGTAMEIHEPHGLKPLDEWLPEVLANQENLDASVQNAKDLYKYALEMVTTGKSDEVTDVSEVCDRLPLVRIWIETHALHPQHQ